MAAPQIYSQCFQCENTTKAFTIGTDNNATGNNSFAGGFRSGTSGENSFVFGNNSKVTQSGGIAIGDNAYSNAANSIVFGKYVTGNAANSITMGMGNSSLLPLINSKPNSIMFGVNNIPSLTIVQPFGANLGFIGIGTDTPKELLHITGNILSEGDLTVKDKITLTPDYEDNTFWEIERKSDGLNFGYTQPGLTDTISTQDKGIIPNYGSLNRLFIKNSNGYVGIGTTNPAARLDVNGSFKATNATIAGTLTANAINVQTLNFDFIDTLNTNVLNANSANISGALKAQSTNITGNLTVKPGTFGLTVGSAAIQSLNYGTSYIGFNAARNYGTWTLGGDGVNNGGSVIWNTIGGQLYFATIPSTGGTTQILTDAEVMSNIKLHLTPSGKLKAKEVEVTLADWPDYVFEDDYKLMNLSDLNNFIKTNKHLPDVTPAAEMEAEGINLGEMNALLLKKVEELTLYILQMEQRVSELENQKGGE